MKNLYSRISRSYHWISLILFLQALASPVFAIAYCPSGCLCSLVRDVKLDVKCENIGLTNVSYNIPRNASYLILKKNSIERISNKSWQGFDRLLFLDLSENLISSINKTTFSNLSSTLRYLYIDNNKISSIAAGAFHMLTKLIALTLNFNRLIAIKQGMLDGLPVLNHLYIFGNQLSVVEESALKEDINLIALSFANNQLGLQAVKNVTKHNLRYLRKLYLHMNVIETITKDLFFGMERLDHLDLGFNKISHIDENGFRGLGRVAWLRLRDNPFKKLVFTGMTSLTYIDASQTPYLTIDASTFINASQLTEINFIQSGFTDIPNNTFLPLGNVKYVYLSGIKMSEFEPGTFRGLKKCFKLEIYHMYLTRITNETFSYLEERLIILFAAYNRIDTIQPSAFKAFQQLRIIDLRANKLTHINRTSFTGLHVLSFLQLAHNRMIYIEDGSFDDLVNLHFLDLSRNYLTTINANLFFRMINIAFLCLTNNKINLIADGAFWNTRKLKHILLEKNKISSISKYTFIGATALEMIMLYDNPLHQIEAGAFAYNPKIYDIYLLRTSINILEVGWFSKDSKVDITFSASLTPRPILVEQSIHLYGLQYLGFACERIENQMSLCTPCSPGTYRGGNGCVSCPLGGFYQDEVAHIGAGPQFSYKTCPKGMYVSLDKAPGKSETDCGACPKGTDSKQLAGHRACKCLEGFYRLDRFGECHFCKTGYICSNESVALAATFYWKWDTDEDKNEYIKFKKELQIEETTLNPIYFKFSKSLPTPYRCPVPQACLGGLDSKCAPGHKGPLCAVCADGYYSMVTGCQKCPSIPWLCGQIFLILLGIILLVYFLLKDKKKQGSHGRTISDVTVARLKIVLGFYQITSLILDAFSFVKWPTSFSILIRYIKLVQLNLFQLVPFHCVSHRLRVDSYVSLILIVVINIGTVTLIMFVYYIFKAKIVTRSVHSFEQRHEQRISLRKLKERCSKAVFLVMFMTYPAVSSSILNMVPQACEEVCITQEDEGPQQCKYYLRGDYTVECFTPKYNKFLFLVYLLVPYPILLPIITIVLLKKYCKSKNKFLQEKYLWLMKGLSFLYENYSDEYWYWEALEMIRKFFLTSFLLLLDQRSRTFLCISSISTELYAVIFAYNQPIADRFEYYLQLVSVGATSVNLSVGMLLKIPDNEMTSSAASHMEIDALAMTVLLIAVNVVVLLVVLVRSIFLVLEGVQKFRRPSDSKPINQSDP